MIILNETKWEWNRWNIRFDGTDESGISVNMEMTISHLHDRNQL